MRRRLEAQQRGHCGYPSPAHLRCCYCCCCSFTESATVPKKQFLAAAVSCCAAAAGSAAARPLRLLQPGASLVLLLLLLLAPCVLLLVQAWGSGIAAPSCSRLRALPTARLAGGISNALVFALSSPFAVVDIVLSGGGSGARGGYSQ